MDKTQFEEKMIQLLKDLSYKAIKKDPTAKLERFKQEVISTVHIGGNWQTNIRPVEEQLQHSPQIYGLPKVHKRDPQLRPIVSCIDSMTYKLAKELTKVISPLTRKSASFVNNSYDFVKETHNLHLPKNFVTVSFDVTQLFTGLQFRSH